MRRLLDMSIGLMILAVLRTVSNYLPDGGGELYAHKVLRPEGSDGVRDRNRDERYSATHR